MSLKLSYVLFFQQIMPEASRQEYIDLGIPEECVELLQALGFNSVDMTKPRMNQTASIRK